MNNQTFSDSLVLKLDCTKILGVGGEAVILSENIAEKSVAVRYTFYDHTLTDIMDAFHLNLADILMSNREFKFEYESSRRHCRPLDFAITLTGYNNDRLFFTAGMAENMLEHFL